MALARPMQSDTSAYASRLYALVNRWDSRHLDTVERILNPQEEERLLEIGCGRGHLTKRLRQLGTDAVGVDANPNAAEMAVTEGVVAMDATDLEFDDDYFDHLVSVHAIEHIDAIDVALSEMSRVLKPGGKALHIYPAEPVQGIWAVPTAVILHGNPFKATEVHCNWLYPSKLARLARPHGFDEIHSEFNLLTSPQFVSLFQLT